MRGHRLQNGAVPKIKQEYAEDKNRWQYVTSAEAGRHRKSNCDDK